jgi:hypothetical protein
VPILLNDRGVNCCRLCVYRLAALAVKISRNKNSEDTANPNEISPVEINLH